MADEKPVSEDTSTVGESPTVAPEAAEKVTKASPTKAEKKGNGKSTSKTDKGNGKSTPIAVEFAKKADILSVPLGSITAYDNPRHEPSNLYEMGFTLVGDPTVEEASEDGTQRVSLLHLALSSDMEEVQHYCSLIEEHESVNRDKQPLAPQSISELAQDIQRYGQLYPILVKTEKSGVRVIDGGRRIAAMLYLHAKSRLNGKKSFTTIDATTRKCKPEETFLLSLAANLSRKEFGPLQEGRVYHEMLAQINPDTQKTWTMKEAAEFLGVGYSTFRNREALWRPKDPATGKGLTDNERAKVAAGEMLLTAASRKALGEKHYSETGEVSKTRRKPIPLSEIQKKFDDTDETKKDRRQAFAECMGLTLKEATQESEKRIASGEIVKRRKK